LTIQIFSAKICTSIILIAAQNFAVKNGKKLGYRSIIGTFIITPTHKKTKQFKQKNYIINPR